MTTNHGIWRKVMFALTFLCATNCMMAQRNILLYLIIYILMIFNL